MAGAEVIGSVSLLQLSQGELEFKRTSRVQQQRQSRIQQVRQQESQRARSLSRASAIAREAVQSGVVIQNVEQEQAKRRKELNELHDALMKAKEQIGAAHADGAHEMVFKAAKDIENTLKREFDRDAAQQRFSSALIKERDIFERSLYRIRVNQAAHRVATVIKEGEWGRTQAHDYESPNTEPSAHHIEGSQHRNHGILKPEDYRHTHIHRSLMPYAERAEAGEETKKASAIEDATFERDQARVVKALKETNQINRSKAARKRGNIAIHQENLAIDKIKMEEAMAEYQRQERVRKAKAVLEHVPGEEYHRIPTDPSARDAAVEEAFERAFATADVIPMKVRDDFVEEELAPRGSLPKRPEPRTAERRNVRDEMSNAQEEMRQGDDVVRELQELHAELMGGNVLFSSDELPPVIHVPTEVKDTAQMEAGGTPATFASSPGDITSLADDILDSIERRNASFQNKNESGSTATLSVSTEAATFSQDAPSSPFVPSSRAYPSSSMSSSTISSLLSNLEPSDGNISELDTLGSFELRGSEDSFSDILTTTTKTFSESLDIYERVPELRSLDGVLAQLREQTGGLSGSDITSSETMSQTATEPNIDTQRISPITETTDTVMTFSEGSPLTVPAPPDPLSGSDASSLTLASLDGKSSSPSTSDDSLTETTSDAPISLSSIDASILPSLGSSSSSSMS